MLTKQLTATLAVCLAVAGIVLIVRPYYGLLCSTLAILLTAPLLYKPTPKQPLPPPTRKAVTAAYYMGMIGVLITLFLLIIDIALYYLLTNALRLAV
jgi:hypothetical protein